MLTFGAGRFFIEGNIYKNNNDQQKTVLHKKVIGKVIKAHSCCLYLFRMMAFTIGRFLHENNIQKKKNNKKQQVCQSYIINYCCKIFHKLFAFPRNVLARNNATIPRRNRDVKKKTNSLRVRPNCSSITAIINHAAEMLTKTSDNISNQPLSSLNIALAYSKTIIICKY